MKTQSKPMPKAPDEPHYLIIHNPYPRPSGMKGWDNHAKRAVCEWLSCFIPPDSIMSLYTRQKPNNIVLVELLHTVDLTKVLGGHYWITFDPQQARQAPESIEKSGIYLCKYDTSDEAITKPGWEAGVIDPSFLNNLRPPAALRDVIYPRPRHIRLSDCFGPGDASYAKESPMPENYEEPPMRLPQFVDPGVRPGPPGGPQGGRGAPPNFNRQQPNAQQHHARPGNPNQHQRTSSGSVPPAFPSYTPPSGSSATSSANRGAANSSTAERNTGDLNNRHAAPAARDPRARAQAYAAAGAGVNPGAGPGPGPGTELNASTSTSTSQPASTTAKHAYSAANSQPTAFNSYSATTYTLPNGGGASTSTGTSAGPTTRPRGGLFGIPGVRPPPRPQAEPSRPSPTITGTNSMASLSPPDIRPGANGNTTRSTTPMRGITVSSTSPSPPSTPFEERPVKIEPVIELSHPAWGQLDEDVKPVIGPDGEIALPSVGKKDKGKGRAVSEVAHPGKTEEDIKFVVKPEEDVKFVVKPEEDVKFAVKKQDVKLGVKKEEDVKFMVKQEDVKPVVKNEEDIRPAVKKEEPIEPVLTEFDEIMSIAKKEEDVKPNIKSEFHPAPEPSSSTAQGTSRATSHPARSPTRFPEAASDARRMKSEIKPEPGIKQEPEMDDAGLWVNIHWDLLPSKTPPKEETNDQRMWEEFVDLTFELVRIEAVVMVASGDEDAKEPASRDEKPDVAAMEGVELEADNFLNELAMNLNMDFEQLAPKRKREMEETDAPSKKFRSEPEIIFTPDAVYA